MFIETLKGKRYVVGSAVINIKAEIPNGIEIPTREQAISLLDDELQELAGSNDGSEILANADIRIRMT